MAKGNYRDRLLLSVTEVAEMIGFGRTRAYELVKSGAIPSYLIDGRIRIKRSDLDAWIDSGYRDMPAR